MSSSAKSQEAPCMKYLESFSVAKERTEPVHTFQKQAYIKYMEDHPEFAANVVTATYTEKQREQDWHTLLSMLNVQPGSIKNRIQWKSTFRSWQNRLQQRFKKIKQENSKCRRLSTFELKSLRVMGKSPVVEAGSTTETVHEISDDSSSDEGTPPREEEPYPYPTVIIAKTEPHKNSTRRSSASRSTAELPAQREPMVRLPQDESKEKRSPMIIKDSFTLGGSLQPPHTKRGREEDCDCDKKEAPSKKTKESTQMEENTKAVRQQTAAIMSLSDAITSLTTAIRTYMYSND